MVAKNERSYSDLEIMADFETSETQTNMRSKTVEKVENSVLCRMLDGTGIDMSLEHWYKEDYVANGLGAMKGFLFAALFSLPFWAAAAFLFLR